MYTNEIEDSHSRFTDSIDSINHNPRNNSKIRLFISHSSNDKDIISDLIFLFQNSMNGLTDSDIRCSSVKGYEFRTGEDFLDMIKKESDDCEYILSMFSNNSLSSSMVLFECGIGWYKDKVIPVIIDKKIDYKDLPLPYQTKVTKKVYDNGDLLDLIDHLADIFQLKKNQTSKIAQLVISFIEKNFPLKVDVSLIENDNIEKSPTFKSVRIIR